MVVMIQDGPRARQAGLDNKPGVGWRWREGRAQAGREGERKRMATVITSDVH